MKLYRYHARILSKTKGTAYLKLKLGFNISRKQDFVIEGDIPALRDVTAEIIRRWTRDGPVYTARLSPPGERVYRYRAEIKSIYDGDTATETIVNLGFEKQEFKLNARLLGIDTPELNRKAERAAGLVARDRLRELVLNKRVIIETEKDKTGKYGRYLVTIFYRRKNINQLLLDEGLAVPYGK